MVLLICGKGGSLSGACLHSVYNTARPKSPAEHRKSRVDDRYCLDLSSTVGERLIE